MTNTITLTKTATGWNATYTGPGASEILKIMGTATIPTAFTPHADPQRVVDRISALNPGFAVVIGQ